MTELVPAESCRIVARPHLFKAERIERTVKAGGTLADLLAEAIPDRALHPYAVVFLGDAAMIEGAIEIPRDRWHRVRPKPGTVVQITLVPQGGGGKNPLRILFSIAIAAASFFLGGFVGGTLLMLPATTTLGGLIPAGIPLASAVGGFLIPCAGPLLIASVPPRKETSQ